VLRWDIERRISTTLIHEWATRGNRLLAPIAALAVAASLAMISGAPAAASSTPPPGKPPAPAPSDAPAPPSDSTATTISVPEYHQQHPLSCEESALSMVLAFYGHPPASASPSDQKARENQLFDYIGVDRTHWWAGPGSTETAAQQAIAGDPYTSFVGNPDGSEVTGVWTGYGTYYPNIARAAAHFGAPVAWAGSGIDPWVLYQLLRTGHPIEVWVSFDLKAHNADDYTAFDGSRIIYHGPWEHTMVLSGIDSTGVRVNDPDRTQYWITFAQFETAYAQYGNMAVVFG
jgi:uncharacterized protein YvpB